MQKNRSEDIIQFNQLFDLYFTSLCYYANKIIKEKEEAEDIVVDSFRKYWVSGQQKEIHPAQAKSFLYLVTRNACFDFLKHKKRTPKKTDDFFNLSNEEAIAEAERLVTEAEFLRLIYLEAAKLPDKCRTVFELTYFEGLTTAQIAQRLNMSISNVTTQRSRAVQLLKSRILTDEKLYAFFLALIIVAKSL